MISLLLTNVSKQLLTCLIKPNILKCLWCLRMFSKRKIGNRGYNLDMTGDKMTRSVF